jgi:hypothetical protein
MLKFRKADDAALHNASAAARDPTLLATIMRITLNSVDNESDSQ